MKLWINMLVATLLLHGVSVFAESSIYLYGEKPAKARDNSRVFNATKLNELTKKYYMYLDPIGPGDELYFPVRARELRRGVYLLQFNKDNYTGDLIFKNLKAAQDFEQELKKTAATDQFYGQPVGYPGTNEVISVGYMEKYPANPSRYKVRYYFLNNRWGWKPEKNE